MTRRLFVAALAGAAAARGDDVVLQAVYGANLPATLRVRGLALPLRKFYERRVYRGPSGEQSYLIPWDSMEQRSRAWARLNSDSEWARLRGQARLTEVTIYRP